MFFFFSDHLWPAQLLAHTTFGPDRLLAQTTFFYQTFFCPNLCEPSLTPKNLSSGHFVAHVLFFGLWTSLRGTLVAQDHPVRDPPLCCVVLCCVFKIFMGASKIWALPPTLPPPDPPTPDRPKFRSFFPPFPPQCSFFLPLQGVFSFFEFWWCY